MFDLPKKTTCESNFEAQIELRKLIANVKAFEKAISDLVSRYIAMLDNKVTQQDLKIYKDHQYFIDNINQAVKDNFEPTLNEIYRRISEIIGDLSSATDDITRLGDDFDEIERDINQLETELSERANTLKGGASGEIVRVDDVSPVQHNVKVKISGVDSPDETIVTRCGKNLLKFPYFDEYPVENGITFTPQSDGGIKINGTANGNIANYILYDTNTLKLPKGKYTIKLNGGIEKKVYLVVGKGTAGVDYMATTEGTFEVTEDGYIQYCVIQVAPNETINNLIVYPQLEMGDKATSYEKYNAETFEANVEGEFIIPSIAPTMTLVTDTQGAIIDLEYNKDINKYEVKDEYSRFVIKALNTLFYERIKEIELPDVVSELYGGYWEEFWEGQIVKIFEHDTIHAIEFVDKTDNDIEINPTSMDYIMGEFTFEPNKVYSVLTPQTYEDENGDEIRVRAYFHTYEFEIPQDIREGSYIFHDVIDEASRDKLEDVFTIRKTRNPLMRNKGIAFSTFKPKIIYNDKEFTLEESIIMSMLSDSTTSVGNNAHFRNGNEVIYCTAVFEFSKSATENTAKINNITNAILCSDGSTIEPTFTANHYFHAYAIQ